VCGTDRGRNRQRRGGACVVTVEEAEQRVALRTGHATVTGADRKVDLLVLLGDDDRMIGAVIVGNGAHRYAVAMEVGASGERCGKGDRQDRSGPAEPSA